MTNMNVKLIENRNLLKGDGEKVMQAYVISYRKNVSLSSFKSFWQYWVSVVLYVLYIKKHTLEMQDQDDLKNTCKKMK